MRIINAHQNNLKNISLSIPERQLIAVTGLSGSGKSSLAMEVIANEGYRFFLESLLAYNRQHQLVIPTAEVDEIKDLPPVIKVEQSKRFRSVNTTFGTLSELTAIFRIIFARYSNDKIMSRSLFSFNHPKGACERCNGIGREEYIDLDKLVAYKEKTLREGAIATTLPNGYIVYSQVTVDELNKVCKAHGFDVDTLWKELTDDQKDVILNGSARVKVFYGKHSIESRLKWTGLKAKPREEGFYKGMLPIMNDILRRDRNPNILKFVSSRICPDCHGARIKAEHLQYTWKGYHFAAWMDMPLSELYDRLTGLDLSSGERMLVNKINLALFDMLQLGMDAYRLNTPSMEISSGDAQRLKLIKQVNSNLQGLLYVFDEPSIGLPASCQEYLHHIFDRLIKRGNTVMVVEHDLRLLLKADWILELGPGAGNKGGEVVFNGPMKAFLQQKDLPSATLKELRRLEEDNSVPAACSPDALNLKPTQFTVVHTKTMAMLKQLQDHCRENGLQMVEVNDQPIGKTPRSNPATYTGLADRIRDLLVKTAQAKALKLAKGSFSFNNKAGRCEACEGAGVITLSMNVMGTINQTCPTCNGKRFKPEVLQVLWNGKHIAAIYDLSIKEAYTFFKEEGKISKILDLMLQLGLGYIKLGQPSNTLSGGEAQRIKLTKHFAKSSKNTLLVLEQPGIGLHYQNVRELLSALHELKEETAGIVCFENHPLFSRSADVFIDNAIPERSTVLKAISEQQSEVIEIKGARTHHLKDLDLDFPKGQLSVISGISGSGKSSLVIDTLHAYGLQEMTSQFSTYQRSRAGGNTPFEVDVINALTPTICITRKERGGTERSDIALQTGIDKVLRFAFSRKAQAMGEELSASHFSRNHDLGKCKVCDGLGEELMPDLNKIVLDEEQSISGGVFAHNKALAYYGQPGSQYMAIAEEVGRAYGFDKEKPIGSFTPEQKKVLFYGAGDKVWTTTWNFKTKTREGSQEVSMDWSGIFNYLKEEYHKTRKNKNIEKLTSLFSPMRCSQCEGSGLLPERAVITIGGKSLQEVRSMDFNHLKGWLQKKDVEAIDRKLLEHIGQRLLSTVNRAQQLHIDHLQLNRRSLTLSGGEQQRVALITQLNSPLKGVTYLLDEPSAGLSADNIPDLIGILKELVAKGNTAVVIEHNKEIIMSADHLVELGPGAGVNGGALTYKGTPQGYLSQSHAHPYFNEPATSVALSARDEAITIESPSRHTLTRKEIRIPVGGITAISGKSGIGKTTLVKEILIPSMTTGKPVYCKNISYPKTYSGAFYFEPEKLRSHTTTLLVSYLDLLKDVTKVFAKQTGLKPGVFSFKTKGSQCPQCKGEGTIEIALDIAANAVEVCEACNGTRYKAEVLEYRIEGVHVAEVLGYDLSTLRNWFATYGGSTRSIDRLGQLESIGLGHLRSDQRVRSLSSGERQRLLLLNWLKEGHENALFILDEPGIGLHYNDIDLLYAMLEKLSKTNDVLIIDHNPYLLQRIGVGIHMK
ncbi:ATP-binding cassette domain-containing protein [Robertkochia sediminum]|uniref:ATP-binding cassette domain-containing protein n=1 Tax=Robertkochia sediminum TaxID=2785326 RepID=UPI0019334591|nr:ATP-binding cassette domain-containing protein [Robertkochia sediminum]MBL7473105.1 ATP-binding cassette domain-containing protein [Robertkochia sediminum]